VLLGDFRDRVLLRLPHHLDLLLFTESTLPHSLSRRSRRGSL
jgi:hypothetical protein